jgi:hypothetical protein
MVKGFKLANAGSFPNPELPHSLIHPQLTLSELFAELM